MPQETLLPTVLLPFPNELMTLLKKHREAKGHSKEAVVEATRSGLFFKDLAREKRRRLRAAVWFEMS